MRISEKEQILIDFLFKVENEPTPTNAPSVERLYDKPDTAVGVLGSAARKGLIYKKDMGTDFKDICYFLTDEGRKYVKYGGENDLIDWENK